MNELMELYQFEGCPYCRRAREKLDELGLDYVIRSVNPDDRTRVEEVSGQTGVPVLVNGDKVVTESDEIVQYLEEHYG